MVVRAASMLWLCWRAIWMASSSVILVGPEPWLDAELASANARVTVATTRAPIFPKNTGLFKGGLRFRKLIAISCDPDIKCGEQNDAQQQIGNQSTHDHDCERPLRI